MATFNAELLNGKFNYPGVRVTDLKGNNYLFDCGEGTIGFKESNNLKAVFISHHHIDHFLGFDRIIAHRVGADNVLDVYGPSGNIDRVAAKLDAYHWNLIEETAVQMRVHELEYDGITSAVVAAPQGLEGIARNSEANTGDIRINKDTRLQYAVLDHGTPSVAYSLVEPDFVQVDKAKLKESGLVPGPWLSQVKDQYDTPGSVVTLNNGEQIPIEQVSHLIVPVQGMKITYATDFGYSSRNVDLVVALAQGSDILYCESNFLAEDENKAQKAHHLTAEHAGMIAQEARVGELRLFHHSRKYLEREEEFVEQARKHYTGNVV